MNTQWYVLASSPLTNAPISFRVLPRKDTAIVTAASTGSADTAIGPAIANLAADTVARCCVDSLMSLPFGARDYAQPLATEFSPARVEAGLRLANRYVRAELKKAATSSAAADVVAATVWNGQLVTMYVGSGCAAFLVRGGTTVRLTSTAYGDAGLYTEIPQIVGLGVDDDCSIHRVVTPLAQGDLVLLAPRHWWGSDRARITDLVAIVEGASDKTLEPVFEAAAQMSGDFGAVLLRVP